MITSFPYSALRGFCKAIYGNVDILMTPTVYTLDFGDFVAGQQKTVTAQINANSDFVLIGAASSSVAGPADGLFNLVDSSNSLSLMSSPLTLGIWAQEIGTPLDTTLHYPYWIQQNSAFIGTYLDDGGAVESLRVSLIGFQVREYR